MIRVSFNDGWEFRPKVSSFAELGGASVPYRPVTLPHDAMIGQERVAPDRSRPEGRRQRLLSRRRVRVPQDLLRARGGPGQPGPPRVRGRLPGRDGLRQRRLRRAAPVRVLALPRRRGPVPAVRPGQRDPGRGAGAPGLPLVHRRGHLPRHLAADRRPGADRARRRPRRHARHRRRAGGRRGRDHESRTTRSRSGRRHRRRDPRRRRDRRRGRRSRQVSVLPGRAGDRAAAPVRPRPGAMEPGVARAVHGPRDA